ncbi:ExbD/TolR family protein [Yoonia sp. SS1-5]|uniref:ExbD/TolR family protein n=2 Tax=Yoonia rhodophyticola TaxID=3137370 RepID=A0ABZ3JBD9_9RHOB
MSQTAQAYSAHAHPVMQPRSSARYKFALTPLADAMFQLLIFFMLTSSLTPYSLLVVQSGPEAGNTTSDPTAAPPTDEPIIPGENAQLWYIAQGEITANGAVFPMEQLPTLAAAIGQNPLAEIILVMEDAAQVQDLTSVLEALTAAGVTSVQLARQGGA